VPIPFRYARLGYILLQVTDLSASIRFYVDLVGLSLAHADHRIAWLRCSDKPYDIVLEQGSSAGIRRIGLELEDITGVGAAFDHVARLGLHPAWLSNEACTMQRLQGAFRFHNPDTRLEMELYAGQSSAEHPFEPTVANIVRLGHVVLNTRSFPAAHRFWIEQLGFVVSDHVPGRIAFMRCFPNPLHHTLALISSGADGLNHFNFMVTDIDDVGRAMNRMKKANVPVVFGPGRHLPSGSIFLYFLDPDGMTAEYSFGMEEIGEHGGRPPRVLEARPEVLDTWGSVPDPRFGKTGAIVTVHA
jgi:2,3-dihydroxy-p-cumate/2,3-dihydroxybenzoate 3,4-dioxygenase